MTKDDRNLLIQDLSARLLYNVKCQVHDEDYILSGITSKLCNELYFEELDFKECDGYVSIEYCKPYLFPLSSMTEEQDREFSLLQVNTHKDGFLYVCDCASMITWLNKNHFDYRGLIPNGLAIDCTNLNIY